MVQAEYRATNPSASPAQSRPSPNSGPSNRSGHSSGSSTRSGSSDAASSGTTEGHLSLFNQQIQKSNRTLEWTYNDPFEDAEGDNRTASSVAPSFDDVSQVMAGVKGSKTTPTWSARVIVDGEVYGHGKGRTKKIAKNEAARQGLEKLGMTYIWNEFSMHLLVYISYMYEYWLFSCKYHNFIALNEFLWKQSIH